MRLRGWLLGIACLVLGAGASAGRAVACDTERLAVLVQATLPEYAVMDVRSERGLVTIRLMRRDAVGTVAIGAVAFGSKLATEVMSAQLGDGESSRVSALVGGWFDNQDLRTVLAQCNVGGADLGDGTSVVLRQAVERVLAGDDRFVTRNSLRPATLLQSGVFVGALLASLVLVYAPWAKSLAVGAAARRAPPVDRVVLLTVSVLALALAGTVAWRLGPEEDEIVTLGTRHGVLAYLLSWADGGEPFYPPGGPVIFALWLRMADGFLWARVLSVALVPVTAWLAYRAGTAAVGRAVGCCFAALVVLAPAYLRLAALARGYSLIVCALCWQLAALAETKQRANERALARCGERRRSHPELLVVAARLGSSVDRCSRPARSHTPGCSLRARRHGLDPPCHQHVLELADEKPI